MKFQPKKWIKPALVLAAFAAMVVYAGGFLHRKTPPDALAVPAGVPLPGDAVLFEVTAKPHASLVEVIGTTSSDRNIRMSSRLSAYVEETLVGAGDVVTNGQVLMRLDQREIREQLAAAEAQLNQAQAEYRRTKQLFERNAATEQSVTAAESAFRTAKANADRVQANLSYATLVSPINGVVTEREVEAGDLASPGQFLLGLYDPAVMRLEVPVPLRLIDHFALGGQVNIRLDHPATSFTGTVSEISGEIDPASRTRKVKLRLSGADGRVLPGAFGRIRIDESPRNVLTVPRAAIFRVGQLTMVHVAVQDRMLRRLVRTGADFGEEVEVLSGLDQGDRVVMPHEGGSGQ